MIFFFYFFSGYIINENKLSHGFTGVTSPSFFCIVCINYFSTNFTNCYFTHNVFPLYHSYLRCSFIISHSRIFARDNDGGILPITKRELRDRDYKEALAEIQQHQDAWVVGKEKIQKYGEQIKNTSGSTKELTDNLSKENRVVRDSVQEFIDSGLAFDEYAKKKEDAFENDKLSQKPKDFKQSIKGMTSSALATVGNMAVNAVGGILLEQLAIGLFSVVDGIIHESEYKIADGKEAKENIIQQTKAYQSQKETLEGLTAEYRRLAKGVKISGNAIENVSLTDEKFQSFLDTSNQIAAISPTLVRTWDSQGNAILTAGTNSSYLNNSIEDYLKLQRDITHVNTKENIQTYYEGILEEVEQYKKSQKKLKKSLDDQKETTEAYVSLRDSLKDVTVGKNLDVALPVDKAHTFSKTLRDEGIDFSGKYLQETGEMAYTIYTSKLTEEQIKDLSVLAEQYEYTSKANEKLTESQIKEQEVLSKAKYKEISDDLQSYIETSNMFDNLGQSQSDIFKNGINDILKNIDFSALQKPIEEAGGLPSWLDKNLIAPMVSGSDAVRAEWEALFNIEKLKDTDSIGVWAKERNKHLNKLSELTGYTPKEIAQSMGYGSLDENGDFYWVYKNRIDNATSHMFGKDYSKSQRKKMGDYLNSLTEEEFEVAMSLVVNSDGAITSIEQLKSTVEKQMGTATQISLDDELSVDSMKTRISDIQASLAAFSTAMNETNSATGLTYDTINALSSSFDTLIDSGSIKKNDLFSLFERTASGVRLNEEALRKLSSVQEEVIRQDLAKSVKAQYDAYKEAKDNVGEYLNNKVVTQDDVADAWGVYQKALQQQSLFESIVSDRAQWFAGTTEAYANYDTTLSKLSSLKNLRKDSQGMEWIGTNEFRQGVDYFYSGSLDTASGEEIAHVYDTLMPMVQDWYQINEDGSRNVSGSIDAFIEDITALPSILGDSASSIDKENKKATLSIKEMADAYGVSGEALEDFAGLFESLGWDVSWVEGFTQNQKQGTIENPAERIFSDKETQATYDGIVSGIQNADEATKGLVDSLNQYTSEELRAINYSDGLYDPAAPEGAEKAVDSLRKSLGLSTDQTQLLLTALEAMGVIKLKPQVDSSDITESTDELKELQEQGKISSDIDLEFNVNDMSLDEIDSKIDELNKEKIRLETEGDTTGLDTIQNTIDSLKNTRLELKIKAQINKGVSYESLLNMSDEQLSKTLQIDSSQVDEARVKLEELSQITTEAPVTVKIDETQLNTLTEGSKNVTVTAKAEGKEEVDALQNSIDNVHGRIVPVKANVFGTDEVNELSEAIDTVHENIVSVGANVFGTDKVEGLASAINAVNSKTVTITTNHINRTINMTASQSKYGPHTGYVPKASGTVLSPARASGTAYNVLNLKPISSYASGKVSLEKDEPALINELGQESIIRDGVWSLIPGKMHVENLKKGDIILNVKQTRDLLQSGKTNSFAKAYSSGTSPRIKLNDDTKRNTDAIKENTQVTQVTGEALDKAIDTINNSKDWIETKLSRDSDKTDLYREKAESDYVSVGASQKYFDKAESALKTELNNTIKAKDKYIKKAEQVAKEVGLSSDLKKKVQNGTIDIQSLSEDDKKRVEAYSQWYEKIVACTESIRDLKDEQDKLAESRFQNTIDKFDSIAGIYSSRQEYYQALRENRVAHGLSQYPQGEKGSVWYQQIGKEKDYVLKEKATKEKSLAQLKKDAADYLKVKGNSKSDIAYKNMISSMTDLKTEIIKLDTTAANLEQEMRDAKLQHIDWKVEEVNRKEGKHEAILDYKGVSDRKEDQITEKDYEEGIRIDSEQINMLYKKREELIRQYREAFATSNNEKAQEYLDKLAETEQEIIKNQAEIEEKKNAIMELRLKPYYDAQKALSDVINEYQTLQKLLGDTESFFNDDGSFTTNGLANIVLLQESIDATKTTIANATKQLDILQQHYANGNLSEEEYKERTEEVMETIRNSSTALAEYKQQMLGMYETQIKMENSLLVENIDKRLQALDAKEKYYEYDKTIKKKSKDINALKVQIAALEGTSNAAAKARLEKLKAELSDAEEDMDDTVHKHEQEMKKYGYEQLQNEAETALENTLDALKKNTAFQEAVISQMLDTTKANYDEAYNHLNEVIKQHGLVVTETYNQMIGAVADFNDKAVQFTPPDASVNNQDTSHIETGHNGSGNKVDNVINSSTPTTMLEDVQKWYSKLKDWNGPPQKGASGLATYIMKKGKIANRYEFQELADILEIPTPGPENYDEWGVGKLDIKNKMLKKLKEIGFSKGGIVDYGRYIPINTLDELVHSNGEWGMVAARRKELILNEHLSELLQTGLPTAVDIIRKFNTNNAPSETMGRVYNDNTVYEVNIYVDKISNDMDIKKLASAIDVELTKAHVKDMRKLIG